MKKLFAFALALSSLAAAGERVPATAEQDEPPKRVNRFCPIRGDPVRPCETVFWRGQTVGFCCPCCIPEWNELTEAEKDAKLDKAK